jgi:hypothetical protein
MLWTFADINAFIETRFHIHLIKQTIHKILKRDPRVKSCRGILMEDERTEVTQEQILDLFRNAIEAIDGVPSHFVFNTDEMGHQDWADPAEQVCVVPVTHESNHVYLPVSRASKRIKLMACIVADGSATTLQILIPRQTVDNNLFLTGLTPEKVVIRSWPKGHVTAAFFDDWFTPSFFLHLQIVEPPTNTMARRRYSLIIVRLIKVHYSLCCVQNITFDSSFFVHTNRINSSLLASLFGVIKKLLR